jgi:hypothetical protein
MNMTIEQAQSDMRVAYADGAAGVMASALAWLAAAGVAWRGSPAAAALTLFFAGMLIHPAGILLARALGRSARHAPGNPLARLALQGTIWMLACMPLAYVAYQLRAGLFFPAMLLLIGGRYFTFATLYGARSWWLLGGCLIAAAFALALGRSGMLPGALAGGLTEAAFAIVMLARLRR